MKKTICVVTGSRADYGLLSPLLKEIRLERSFDLRVIATGMHLSRRFGLTYKEIEKGGFRINRKLDILSYGDTEEGVAKSTGAGIMKFAEAFRSSRPDIVVLLGDRFEIFAAATAAFIARIPIAHIHGGELTEGAIDDAFRHSITKMSTLHFVTTDVYRKRVIQLGEDPARVFNVGAPGIDNIKNLRLLDKDELEAALGFSFGRLNALVTFHPVTLEKNTAAAQFAELAAALDSFKDLKAIFTRTNADPSGSVINRLIDKYVSRDPGKAVVFTSLGQVNYLSAINSVDLVVGNSSSGIIEVPSFGKPTVNIGDRQKGRVAAGSVINAAPERKAIRAALARALSQSFRESCRRVKNPYGSGGAARRMLNILKKELPGIKDTRKVFYDTK